MLLRRSALCSGNYARLALTSSTFKAQVPSIALRSYSDRSAPRRSVRFYATEPKKDHSQDATEELKEKLAAQKHHTVAGAAAEATKEDSAKQSNNENKEDTSEPTESSFSDKQKVVEDKEVVSGAPKSHGFQAETQKILDIVAQSLYTEREVFVRELISNASDAMEKVRLLQVTGKDIVEKDKDLEINIYANEDKSTLTIQDTGIGMTEEELRKNLGQIGHSGSLEFLKKQAGEGGSSDKGGIIGQFGVGFYSTFMVGNKVKVFSRSATPGSRGYAWESDGAGAYTIAECENVDRGTKIVIELKEGAVEYANKRTIESIIKKYSNFVGFPITVNGERVNTVRALWTMSRSSISEEDHREFYQFIAKAYDTPAYRLHYATDSPLNIRGLFYFPAQHMEKYGMGRLENGVSLFSRKVMIQQKPKGLLPEWLRFIRGVVDSEDIPLNISREHMQDSALIQKLNSVLTKRILKFLDDQAKSDPEAFHKWYTEFGQFLKEGLCTDAKWKEELAKLIRFESSHTEGTKMTTLDEYISRMKEDQEQIYYLVVPARHYADSSPYYEGFKAKGIEVLFLYNSLDDYVMTNLSEYSGKKLMTIESATLDADEKKDEPKDGQLSDKERDEMCTWIKDTIPSRVSLVRETKRLSSTPAIIVDHESASYRRMMKNFDPTRSQEIPKQLLEVNMNHPVIISLFKQRNSNPNLAKEVTEQIMDNALVAAGLIEDPRSMLPRLNALLEKALSAASDLTQSIPQFKKPAAADPIEEEKEESTKEEPASKTETKKEAK